MNLIQQLQQSPKWGEFRTWYNQQDYRVGLEHANDESMFIELEFDFQKGVFEKFIESKGFIIEQWYKNSEKGMWVSLFPDTKSESIFQGTFQELLIWYFNN